MIDKTDNNNQNVLQSPWSYFYDYQSITSAHKKDWDQNVKHICDVDTINQLKIATEEIPKAFEWPVHSNLQFFRMGIMPAWEDEMNRNGKRMFIQINCKLNDKQELMNNDGFEEKDVTKYIQDLWNKTVIFTSFEISKNSLINGCILSPRKEYVRISLWVRKTENGNDYDIIESDYKKFINFEGKLIYKSLG